MVCGRGGCFTFLFNSNGTYSFQKYFRHNNFTYTSIGGLKLKDYVYAVRALETTNYFFTIESMKGVNSSGFLRWDTTNNESCFNRYTANLNDDQNREYYISKIKFTRNIAVSGPGSKNIWIFNYLDLTQPIRTLSITDTVGYNGPIADLNFQPELCQMVTCAFVAKDRACTVFDYRQTTLSLIKRISVPNTAPSASNGQVWVTTYPLTRFVVVAWVNNIYIVDLGEARTTDRPTTPPAYIVLATPTPALTTIASIEADFHFNDLYILLSNQLLPYTFFEAAKIKCFPGCNAAATDCPTNSFQSPGCRQGRCIVAQGYTSTLPPMICYKAPTTPVPVGGLFLTPKAATPIVTTNNFCPNRTNITMLFQNIAVAPMSDFMRAFIMILLSLLILGTIAAPFLLMNYRDKLPPVMNDYGTSNLKTYNVIGR